MTIDTGDLKFCLLWSGFVNSEKKLQVKILCGRLNKITYKDSMSHFLELVNVTLCWKYRLDVIKNHKIGIWSWNIQVGPTHFHKGPYKRG